MHFVCWCWHTWMRTSHDVENMIVWSEANSTKHFKYININKQREASISFKHLQINTWFWPFWTQTESDFEWKGNKETGGCLKKKVEQTTQVAHLCALNMFDSIKVSKGCYVCMLCYLQFTKTGNLFWFMWMLCLCPQHTLRLYEHFK